MHQCRGSCFAVCHCHPFLPTRQPQPVKCTPSTALCNLFLSTCMWACALARRLSLQTVFNCCRCTHGSQIFFDPPRPAAHAVSAPGPCEPTSMQPVPRLKLFPGFSLQPHLALLHSTGWIPAAPSVRPPCILHASTKSLSGCESPPPPCVSAAVPFARPRAHGGFCSEFEAVVSVNKHRYIARIPRRHWSAGCSWAPSTREERRFGRRPQRRSATAWSALSTTSEYISLPNV